MSVLMKGLAKVIAGMGMMAALLMHPEAAVAGVQRALFQWYGSVAPALFPFMALMPLLTSRDSVHIYEKISGWIVRRLFGLPGGAAPAMLIGMIAGSPAGCMAAKRIAAQSGMTGGQLKRTAFAATGFSPGFLITGVGFSVFGDAGIGLMLLRGQIAAQLIMALILKKAWADETELIPSDETEQDSRAVLPAVINILKVAGYMALFGSFSSVAAEMLGEKEGLFAAAVLEITAGAWAVAGLQMDFFLKMILMAGLCGFGGAAACAQNLSALSGCGVKTSEFFLNRCLAALLNMAIMALQLNLNVNTMINIHLRPMIFPTLCMILIIIPIIIRVNNAFLNKRNF